MYRAKSLEAITARCGETFAEYNGHCEADARLRKEYDISSSGK